MIKIIYQTGGDSYRALLVQGHSGHAKKGEDIICSAVSALVENLGLSLTELIGASVEITKSDGYYDIVLTGNDRKDEIKLLFSSTLLGLKTLEKQYPQWIQISKEEEYGA